jgi:ribosomal 50S subunit-associated protein YjgA (DUF615 family)
MKHFFVTTLTVCLLLFPFFIANASIFNHTHLFSISKSASENQDKEKVLEDAKRLGEEFKNLFNDLTELGKNTIEPLANSISEWITNNYANLTEIQKKRLEEFIYKLKKEYENVEELSLETIKDILNNFQEFLRQLREGENFDPAEPLTKT